MLPAVNLIGGLGPGERLRIRMMRVDELANGALQRGDTAVCSTTLIHDG
jgi:hypothetical protein